MADFKKSFAITMGNEGGYVNNSKDAGQETCYGISIKFWPTWGGWPIIHTVIQELRIPTTLDAGTKVWEQITEMLAANENLQALKEAFYKEHFWDVLKLDSEPDQSVANSAFDSAVNMGVAKEKASLTKAEGEADEIV